MKTKSVKTFISTDLELNDVFEKAYKEMEDIANSLFITGKAGTGKSTLLQYFRNSTSRNLVVLAPTGVAALNVKGQTIHSFFKFGINVTPEAISPKHSKNKIYQKLETVIIDEVSMVRADLMDCIDRILRINSDSPELPFGGKQMIFIGDLYQLPPILTNYEKDDFLSRYKSQYFFDSNAFKEFEFKYIELEKVYRQTDKKFISILNSIRESDVKENMLQILNEKVDRFFNPNSKDNYIYLTTTNRKADEINDKNLREIKSEAFVFRGELDGKIDENELPTNFELSLKVGSQVMMVVNDRQGRWVNGSIGKISKIESKKIFVDIDGKGTYEVTPYTWEKYKYIFDEDMGQMVEDLIGSFKQYPLKLAWAITVHKSQGKTFENVIIDMDGGFFAHGQAYVALSRCTSLNGIVLKKPITRKDIFIENRIVDFVNTVKSW